MISSGNKLGADALPENAKCLEYFTPEIDGLNQTCEGTVWMNPPYGKTIKGWIEKAFQEANCTQSAVVSLLPPGPTPSGSTKTFTTNAVWKLNL